MPYSIEERGGQYCVVKRTTGKQVACHATREKAQSQIAAIMANEHNKSQSFELLGEVTKVDDSLGLVFGWAIVCSEGGQPYFDTQGDYIPPDAMLKEASAFMEHLRVAKEMHVGGQRGEIIHSLPLTPELAAAFGITTKRHGWIIGMKPDADMFARFKSGELRGFSIGGRRGDDEPAGD